MYERPTSPKSIGGVLDDGFKLFRASFMKLIGFALVGGFLAELPNAFLAYSTTQAEPLNIGAGFWGIFAMIMIGSVVVYAAIVARVDAVANNREMSVGGALSVAARRAIPMVSCSILYGIVVMLGLLLPGMILGLTLMFAFYAVIIEPMGPVAGLNYSHKLVWGNWWRTAAIVTVAIFIMIVAYAIVALFAGGLATLGSAGDGSLLLPTSISLVVMPLINTVATPLSYSLFMAVYYDLKLRRTGEDLAERIEATSTA